MCLRVLPPQRRPRGSSGIQRLSFQKGDRYTGDYDPQWAAMRAQVTCTQREQMLPAFGSWEWEEGTCQGMFQRHWCVRPVLASGWLMRRKRWTYAVLQSCRHMGKGTLSCFTDLTRGPTKERRNGWGGSKGYFHSMLQYCKFGMLVPTSK